MSKQIPKVEASTRFNLITSIWIVPFIALIIAGWLAYQYFSELGPEIRIVFPENEGLNAGQSQIKYRNVSIGTVKKIVLQKKGEGVTVIARMDKSAKRYLNENAKFWIVKPEVGVSGVSGLDTLISGTYINMYSEKGGEFHDMFYGLDEAFHLTADGVYYQLSSPSGYNIKKGTPLYMKNMEVGQVEYVNIALDGQHIDFIVFVKKQYVLYVHRDSKFWVQSAVDVSFDNGRLDINVAPLSNLMQGGIEFSSSGEDASDTVPDKYVFHLYKNGSIAEGMQVGRGGDYIKSFEIMTEDHISKLKVGALVQYEGYEVGRVRGITLSFNKDTHKILGNVLVEIDTSSFASEDENVTTCSNDFHHAVTHGLRAKFTPSDPLTGSLFVDLIFDHNATEHNMTKGTKYALIPSLKSDEGSVMDEVDKVLQKLNNLPLEKLLASINQVVDDSAAPMNKVLVDLKKTVENLNAMTGTKAFKKMPDELNKTMKELTRTLQATKKLVKGYDNNSLITHQIAQTLKVVTKTSLEMQQFLKLLNRKPNSLIFGDK